MGVLRRQPDMKTELLIVATLSCYTTAANNYGSIYGEYDAQYNNGEYDTQYKNQQYRVEAAQYQPDRYDTAPYQQDSVADRYDTVPYQQNNYATPYQPDQYQPVLHEAVHPAHYQEE